MKPMLAAPVGDTVSLPVFVSPKLDGIRCLIIDGVACSRSLKPLPNKHVQKLFGRMMFNGLDGELIIGSPVANDVFQRTSSGVMSIEGEPDVTFHVFDDFSQLGGFASRYRSASLRVHGREHFQRVLHRQVATLYDLMRLEGEYLEMGYEGVMLRKVDGPYKHGRSTDKEGYLLKLKRFSDGEAEVVGFNELMHNANEAKCNALGQLERSSHKAGKVGAKVLGALVVKDLETGVEFDIGTGFNILQRQLYWSIGDGLLGKVVKYKFQPVGVQKKLRFPVFLGFRDRIDM